MYLVSKDVLGSEFIWRASSGGEQLSEALKHSRDVLLIGNLRKEIENWH